MQGWLKSLNVICHISRSKRKTTWSTQ
jgi:hypothetical protein